MPTEKLTNRRVNKFRAWKLGNAHRDGNIIEKFMDKIDNDGYEWNLTVKDGWVYISAVKYIYKRREERLQ